MVKQIRGHIVESSGIALPNGAEIRSLEQSEGYKYLGILQSDDIKNKEKKQMTQKEHFRRVRKVLKASINGSNTIESINSWAMQQYDIAQEFSTGQMKTYKKWAGKNETCKLHIGACFRKQMLIDCIRRGKKEVGARLAYRIVSL